jgi:hypothetical protein
MSIAHGCYVNIMVLPSTLTVIVEGITAVARDCNSLAYSLLAMMVFCVPFASEVAAFARRIS